VEKEKFVTKEKPSVEDLGQLLSGYRFDEIGLALSIAGFGLSLDAAPLLLSRPPVLAGGPLAGDGEADDPWKHASSARCEHCSPIEIAVSDEVTQWCFEVENPASTAGDNLMNFGHVDVIVDDKTVTSVTGVGGRKKIKWKGKSFKLHYQGTKGKVAFVRYLSC